MIKSLVFDIDGVLVSTRKLHEMAFLTALKAYGYNISDEFHRERLDGLPTKIKMEVVGVASSKMNDIHRLKQKITFDNIDQAIKADTKVLKIFEKYKHDGYKIGIASNAIREFSIHVVTVLGVGGCVDSILGSEDVIEPKPNPEIYIKTMSILGCSPKETLIFEDSKFGLSAAYSSAANVCPIRSPDCLTFDKIQKYVDCFNQ